MKKMIAVLLILAVFCSLLPTWSAGLPAEEAARFPLFAEGKAADLYVSAADYPQIVRAAGDLQKDVERVTAALPEVKTDTSALGQYAVIIGSVEKSPVIAQLMEQGLLDEAKALSGKFEAFVIKMVENPLPGSKVRWSSPEATSAARFTAFTMSPSRSAFRPITGGRT